MSPDSTDLLRQIEKKTGSKVEIPLSRSYTLFASRGSDGTLLHCCRTSPANCVMRPNFIATAKLDTNGKLLTLVDKPIPHLAPDEQLHYCLSYTTGYTIPNYDSPYERQMYFTVLYQALPNSLVASAVLVARTVLISSDSSIEKQLSIQGLGFAGYLSIENAQALAKLNHQNFPRLTIDLQDTVERVISGTDCNGHSVDDQLLNQGLLVPVRYDSKHSFSHI